MPSLPFELLQLIAEHVDSTGLISLRSASRNLCTAVTPLAFRTLEFTNTVKSTNAMLMLLGSNLHVHIREFVYVQWYEKWGSVSPSPLPPHGEDQQACQNIVLAISQLGFLPMLHTVSLTFSRYCDKETATAVVTTSPEEQLQHKIFHTFAALPNIPTLRSFIAHNISSALGLTWMSSDPGFVAFMQGLTHVHLSTMAESPVIDNAYVAFYTGGLGPLLRASADTLTSLTLHSSQDVLGIALEELRCPSLAHVSLERILFDSGAGPEAFLLAHASTLESLRLSRCMMMVFYGHDQPERRWEDVYHALRRGLRRLRQLEVVEASYDTSSPSDESKLRYAVIDSLWYVWARLDALAFPGEAPESVARDEWGAREARALEEFREAVRVRSIDGA
ncbi:hypothetical protein BV25DRAFT_1913131 [Artomyces pyxidatus]|uniref:Uncharacterized protein n=1 Tax=Artomyces pyxidatus TaxID=48021 RepID=A0ACB8TAU3_9AGAM|nr:hypothetical protein BV25DRAFT_1913131 [Artomyces pyxidatus]